MASSGWGEVERYRDEWTGLIATQGAEAWRQRGEQGVKLVKVYGWLLLPLIALNFFARGESDQAMVMSVVVWLLSIALNCWIFFRLQELRPFFPWGLGAYRAFWIVTSLLGCAGVIVWFVLRSAVNRAVRHIELAIKARDELVSPYPREAPLDLG